MQGGAANSSALGSLTLAPGQVQRLNLSSALSAAGLASFSGSLTLELGMRGPSGALLVQAGSVDQTGTYVFEVMPRVIHESASKSIGYWSTANGDDTMVSVWNPADESQDFVLRVVFSGGHYLFPIHLGPRATQSFNISQLIETQLPDSEGNVIPSSVHEGSAVLGGANGDVQHILVALDSGTYNVRKATCGVNCVYCDGYTAFNMTPGSATFAVQKTQQYQFLGTYSSGVKYNVAGPWSSSKTSVATIGSSTGTATGVSPGDANFITSFDEPIYQGDVCTGSTYTCPNASGTPSGGGNVANVSCSPSTVTRGNSVTCTASGPTGSTFSNWTFSDGTNTVNGSGTSSTWSGVMVTSGTVSVTITSNGQAGPASAQVTVNARNWHTNSASPAEVANGTFILLPVPPQNTGDDAGLGYSDWYIAYNGLSGTTVSDNGPNKGYYYYASQLTYSSFFYQYEINPDLENTGSTFYKSQCGNYNASTKPSGFISGSNLLTQTNRHEWNSSIESHYAFYSNSLNSNNLGDYVESRVGPPGTDIPNFDAATANGLQADLTTIKTAAAVEPYAVNDSETGVFLGNINYSPYASCN